MTIDLTGRLALVTGALGIFFHWNWQNAARM
jgi:hypothetical protein